MLLLAENLVQVPLTLVGMLICILNLLVGLILGFYAGWMARKKTYGSAPGPGTSADAAPGSSSKSSS